MSNVINLNKSFIIVVLLFAQAITAKVNPQPGENLWRMVARIGECIDTIGAKINWLESQNDITCSKIEKIDEDLASHNDVVCSKIEVIDSVIDNINSGIDAVCSKLEKVEVDLSVHDASICSKLERVQTNQELELSAIDNIELTDVCETLIFQSDIPYTIASSGVYCLAESVSFDDETAITIASSNVVFDLQEKKIDGAAGGNVGIAINSGLENITIQNGVLCNMNHKGIDADATNNIAFVSMSVMDSLIDMPAAIAPITCLQIKDVKVLNVGMFKEFPIVSVVDSIVDSIIDTPDCVLSKLTGININCATKVVLDNCKVLYGLGDGFALQFVDNGVITSCQAIKNGGNGFVLNNTDTTCLKWCKANMNCFHGVCDSACTGDNVYLGCIAKQNGIHGFNIAGGGKVVQECVASQNTRDGFHLSTSLLNDADLDTTFGNGGIFIGYVVGANDSFNATTLQKDGKIIVAGNVDLPARFFVARLTAGGSFDTTFGTGGIVTTSISGINDDVGNAVAVQEDGKIVVVGRAGTGIDFAAARYNIDGSLDISFNPAGPLPGTVTTDLGGTIDVAEAVVIQKDGKIVAAGHTNANGNVDFAVVRYNTDGSLDNFFGNGGVVITGFAMNSLDRGNAAAIQKDGKIIVAGFSNAQDPNRDFALARYNTDGSLDVTFGVGGLVTTGFAMNSIDQGDAVAIQKDGKIVVAGVSNAQDPNRDFALARYNTDGSLDVTFGDGGLVITNFNLNPPDQANAVAIQKDGKIIAVGEANSDFALARYNANGSLDSTFNSTGIFPGTKTTNVEGNDDANAIAIQQDGKIVVVGNVDSDELGVVRYVVFKRGVAVRNCVAEENGEDGFNIAGQAYDVRDSSAIRNVSDGFLLASLTDNCQLLSNTAIRNSNIGIENLGSNNQIFNSRALNNATADYVGVALVADPTLSAIDYWANIEA